MSAKKGAGGQTRKRSRKGRRKRHNPAELSLNQRLIKALSDPLRVRVLAFMNEGEWSPNLLSEELDVPLGQVSYHVKVLKDFKMIELTRTVPKRGAVEHFYRAVEHAYIPTWMAKMMPKSAQQIIGSDILEEIETDLAASIRSGKFYERDDCHVTFTPLVFDAEGFQQADQETDEHLNRLLEIQSESIERISKSESDPERIPASACFLVFPRAPADERDVSK